MWKLFIIIAFSSCMAYCQFTHAENLTERNALPNVIEYFLNCFAEEQQKTHGLVLVEKITDFDECEHISKLGFLFDRYQVISLSEARTLVANMVSEFLQQINSNVKLKKYFSNVPFSEKNFVVRLRMRTKDCGFIYPILGNIAYVSAIDGSIIYDTINSFTYDLDTLRTESYADALKIISATKLL